MLINRSIRNKSPKRGSFYLDLVLLFVASASVILLLNEFNLAVLMQDGLLTVYVLVALIYTSITAVRKWLIHKQRSSYEKFNQQLVQISMWGLWLVLVWYLVLFIWPVYASGLACELSFCTKRSPVPIYDIWFDFTGPMYPSPYILIVVAASLFYGLLIIVWAFANALLLRLLIKPQTLCGHPRLFWIMYLLALNVTLYFTRPIVSDLLVWLWD
jgi:hypothetical protein